MSADAWAQLLKWNLQNLEATDPVNAGTAAAPRNPMSEADRQFIEDAMRANLVDVTKRCAELLDAASSPEASDDDVVDALEALQDLVEDVDFSSYVVRMGGCVPLRGLLAAGRSGAVRGAACATLAMLAQNNPGAQALLGLTGPAAPQGVEGLLDHLTGMANDAAGATAPRVRARALHACSCFVRGAAAAEDAFCAGPGGAALAAAVASPDVGLARKGTFVLLALAQSDACSAARLPHLWPAAAAAAAAGGLASEDVDVREHTVQLVTALAARAGGAAVRREVGAEAVDGAVARRRLGAFDAAGEADSEEAEMWRKLEAAMETEVDAVEEAGAAAVAPPPPPPPQGDDAPGPVLHLTGPPGSEAPQA